MPAEPQTYTADTGATTFTQRFVAALVGPEVQPEPRFVQGLQDAALSATEKRELVVHLATAPSLLQQVNAMRGSCPEGTDSAWGCAAWEHGSADCAPAPFVMLEEALSAEEMSEQKHRPGAFSMTDTLAFDSDLIPDADFPSFLFS